MMRLLLGAFFWAQWVHATAAPVRIAESPPPVPTANTLAVTKYWYPWRYGTEMPGYYYENILITDDESVWLSHFKPGGENKLARVFLPDFRTQFIPIPSGRHPLHFARSPDALYTTWETHGHDGSGGPLPHEIARLDPITSTWSTHALPNNFDCDVYAAGQALYLTLNVKAGGNETAIARYDWDHDTTTILSSTRRRPAQNQFDDMGRLLYAQLFLGPGNKPCVISENGAFYLQETPGMWPPILDIGTGGRITTACGKTLAVAPPGEIVLLDPQAAAAQPLMMTAQPATQKQPVSGSPPATERPSWATQAPLDAPAELPLYYNNVAFHDGTLFALRPPKIKGGEYDLLCFRPGPGRTARHIPLVFHLDDQGHADFATMPANAPATWVPGQIEHPDTTVFPTDGIQFFATKDGLCLEPFNVGFWFLPYADIEAYLKANPN